MRVLVLAQYYDPVPVPKPSDVARWLAARGHDVSVLTGLPNYPTGVFAPGYGLTVHRLERLDGIAVRRVFEIPYHGTSAVGRILNYGSFMVAASVASLLIRRPDVVYVWHPPLTVGAASSMLSTLRGVPFVYDVQDIWPDSALISGMLSEGAVADALRTLERFVYARAARLLVVTEGAKANLVGKGVPVEKISVVPHWIDDAYFVAPTAEARRWAREFLESDGKFVVTFAGNLGLLQGLDVVLRAAQRLAESNITIQIVGDGTDRPRLEQLARELRLENVRFLGARPVEDMPALFAESDALLVHFRGGPISDLVVPSKTQAYLASGRPIVMAMTGPAGDIVADAGAGLVVAPDDPDRLGAALLELAATPAQERQAMGTRARAYAVAHFRRDDVMGRVETILSAAARRPRRD
jgi:colanic acid biosynthesis glycosyl transferase WcaI